MKTKFILFLLLGSKMLFAQSENDKVIYLDSLQNETTEGKHVFYRIVKDYNLNQPEYRFETYYKSRTLESESNSKNKEYLSKIGLVKKYYENGNPKSEENYEDFKRIGNTILWYENGIKKLEGEFIAIDGKEDTELKINQFWSKDNKQLVVNGNGFLEDDSEENPEKGNVVNGWKDGNWEGKDKRMKYSYKESYKNGKLVEGKSIDKYGVEHTYLEVQIKPRPKKGLQHFYNYIGKNFKVHKTSEDIYGSMILSFVINKEGEAVEVKVLKSLDEKLDNEGMRLIRKYPDWSSAEQRGIKVRVLYSLPIKIAKS